MTWISEEHTKQLKKFRKAITPKNPGRVLAALLFPIFLLLVKVIVNHYVGHDWSKSLGTSIATVAIGALIPFVFFDGLLLGSLLTTKTTVQRSAKTQLSLNVDLSIKKDYPNFEKVRRSIMIAWGSVFLAFLFIAAEEAANPASLGTIGPGLIILFVSIYILAVV